MSQEYITTTGRVIVERDILYLRSENKPFSQTAFFDFLPALLLILPFIHLAYFENNPRWFFRMFFYLTLLFMYGSKLYDVIFKKSFATRIPVSRIRKMEIIPDETISGLETKLLLYLQSGRIRTIAFRTREYQLEPLAEYLSIQISVPRLAH